MTEENQEKCKEIMEKVRSNSSTLHISRIPREARKEFLDLANSAQFVGDYGFTIKYLLDFHKGLIANPNEQVLAQLDILAQEIAEIKVRLNSSEEKKEDEKAVRTLSGRVLKGGNRT